jgi:2,4-dichlorophenol 6-monooxygenase
MRTHHRPRLNALSDATSIEVPVLIVGGGAAGLASSLLLSRLGVETLLVERRPASSDLPKAHILNQRTMEIFDTVDLADEVYEQGSPLEAMGRVAWYTSFAGPTPLHGRELAWRDAWGGGADADRYARVSPFRHTNLPQMRLEPIMRRRAEERAPGRVRFSHELIDLTQDADGVTGRIREVGSGREYSVRAQYALGADGGRTVGRTIGAKLEGQVGLVDMVSTHVIADLSRLAPDPRVSIFWFINPDTHGSIGSGVLIKMGGAGWGPSANEWVFAFATTPDDPTDFDPEYVRERMRRAVGVADLPVEPRRPSRWHIESVVADRYSDGRVFLLGDAAHRHPPTGALGLNTAVQDAHNLAWKLALVLRGDADPALLDTYGAERRPVALHNAEQSLASFFAHAEIDEAIGIDQQSSERSWTAVEALFAEGGPIRARVDAAVDRKGREFSALRRELGYRYSLPAATARSADSDDDGILFEPSGAVGERMPHAWVGSVVERVSTYDLTAPDRFTLFIGADGEPWRVAASGLDAPLDVIAIGDDAMADTHGAWARQTGIGPGGAILVRPDHHIAWRAETAPADAGAALADALAAALGRSLSSQVS